MTARDLVAPELVEGLDAFPPMEFSDEFIAMVRSMDPGETFVDPTPLTPAQASVRREDVFVPGAAGAPDVRILLYTPPGDAGTPRPAYLHIHGGGYVLGAPDMGDRANRAIALEQDCIVAAVTYRLAPETRWPGSLEDCYAALRWLAARDGVDAARIVVGGESAGGGHAAALALAARDRGGPAIAALFLDTPMLDDRSALPVAQDTPVGALVWTRETNHYGWRSLLGVDPGSADVPEGAVPARAADVSGLPPTTITVGSLDLFLDEDLEFARRLAHAGVPVELHVTPGAYHGYTMAGETVPQVAELKRVQRAALARAFA